MAKPFKSRTAERAESIKKIFQPDSKLMNFFGAVGDYAMLGVLWTVAAIPVITIGAATASLYRVSRHLQRHEEESLLKDAWGGFRENFKQATLTWLAVLLAGAFLVIDLWFYWNWAEKSVFGIILFGAFIALAILLLFISSWIFCYISRFYCSFKEAVRNSLILSIRHAGWSLVIIVSNIALLILCLNFSVLLVVWPGMCAFVNGHIFEHVFRKVQILTESRKDSPADSETDRNTENSI